MVSASPEEETVVTRMWRGWTRSEDADRYDRHYRSEVMATLRQVPGFRYDERVGHFETAFQA